MGLSSWLLEKEKRFAWSLLGTVLGLVGLAVGYITTLEKRPDVTMTVIGEANVLDVHSPRNDLQLVFRGEDLQRTNSNVRIIAVRVGNTGAVDILQGQYDQNEQWGYRVDGGRIVEARVIGGNSAYLARALKPTVVGNAVRFAKPILERGRFATVETLVVHSKQSVPQVVPFGKIAGVDQVRVEMAIDRPAPSAWRLLYGGPLWTQAIRAVTYPIVFVVGMALIVAPFVLVSEARESRRRRHRKRIAASLRLRHGYATPVHEAWLDMFVDSGPEALARSRALLMDDRRLDAASQYIRVHPLLLRRSLRPPATGLSVSRLRVDPDDLMVSHEASHVIAHSPDLRRLLDLMNRALVEIRDDGTSKVMDGAMAALESIIDALGEEPGA